jgi:hypothetical protein
MFDSVPTQIGIRSPAVISGVRMMWGVSVSITSLRLMLLVDLPNRRPMIGMSERPGMPVSPWTSSVRMRPARKLVSPSFSRIRLDRALADDRLHLAAPGLDRPGDLRHLDLELERDLAVVVHARLEVDVDADILVLERGDRHDVAAHRLRGVEGGDRDRHLVADPHLGLLPR